MTFKPREDLIAESIDLQNHQPLVLDLSRTNPLNSKGNFQRVTNYVESHLTDHERDVSFYLNIDECRRELRKMMADERNAVDKLSLGDL